jgi:hypothetical protein
MVQKSDSGTPPDGPRDPFAPPPKDAPDRPWQPRGRATERPQGAQAPGGADGSEGSGDPGASGGSGSAGGQTGSGGQGGSGDPGSRPDNRWYPPQGQPGRPQIPPPHPWSPGYQGQQPPRPYAPPPQGPRFDPSDPVQRKARYALLSGMWGIFFMILGVPDLTLVLASLALYWSISALRGTAKPAVSALERLVGPGTPQGPQPPQPVQSPQASPPSPFAGPAGAPGAPYAPGAPFAPGFSPARPARPQVPAATGGLIASIVGLSLFFGAFGVQMYYKNYYDCQNDALTQTVYQTCATSVSPRPPQWLVKLGG